MALFSANHLIKLIIKVETITFKEILPGISLNLRLKHAFDFTLRHFKQTAIIMMRITPNTPPHIPETVLTSEMIKPYAEFY